MTSVECGVHHMMQHLLDGKLSSNLEIGAWPAADRQNRASLVGEQTHRFGSTSVDAENVHSRAASILNGLRNGPVPPYHFGEGGQTLRSRSSHAGALRAKADGHCIQA